MANISNALGMMKFYRDGEEISPRNFAEDALDQLGEDISYEGCGCIFHTGVFTACGKWSFACNLIDYSFARNALMKFMRENSLSDIEITYVDTENGCDFIDIGSFSLNISGFYTYDNVCESLSEYSQAHGLPPIDVVANLESDSFYDSDTYYEQQYRFVVIIENILILEGYQEAVDYLDKKINGDDPVEIFIAKNDKSHGDYNFSEVFDFNYIKYNFVKDEDGDMISYCDLPVYEICTEKEQQGRREKLKEAIKSELNSLLNLQIPNDLREETVDSHLSRYQKSGLSEEELSELKEEVLGFFDKFTYKDGFIYFNVEEVFPIEVYRAIKSIRDTIKFADVWLDEEYDTAFYIGRGVDADNVVKKYLARKDYEGCSSNLYSFKTNNLDYETIYNAIINGKTDLRKNLGLNLFNIVKYGENPNCYTVEEIELI